MFSRNGVVVAQEVVRAIAEGIADEFVELVLVEEHVADVVIHFFVVIVVQTGVTFAHEPLLSNKLSLAWVCAALDGPTSANPHANRQMIYGGCLEKRMRSTLGRKPV